jgi:hypothetical protein
MSKYQSLKGFNNTDEISVNNSIQDNLVEYFDYGFLEKGNYFNVDKDEQSPDGLDYSQLRLSSNDSYVSGQVWEGFRQNWVWQSGINPPDKDAPIVGTDINNPGISGVYIDGNFEPTSGVGTYAHTVDYFNGRVIFDSAIPTGSVVQAEYSYKYINVVYANNVPWLREIQKNTQNPTNNFLDTSQGSWDIPPETRLQLPAIAIEMVPTRKFKGYQLGGGQWTYSDVIFHCIAEDEYTRNQLVDFVSFQNDKSVYLFDSNEIDKSGAFPLDSNGSPVPSALLYPTLLENYAYGKMRITKMMVEGMSTFQTDIYGGTIRATVEVIKTNI